jgi:hypothetical protein
MQLQTVDWWEQASQQLAVSVQSHPHYYRELFAQCHADILA